MNDRMKPTMLSRRRLLQTTGLASIGLVVIACGGGQAQLPTAKPAAAPPATPATTQPTPAAPAAKPAAGVLQVWEAKLFTQAANDLAKKQVTEFAESQGAKADISDIPTDFIAKVIPAIEAGEVPDMVSTDQQIIQVIAANGAADVTEVVKDLVAAHGQPYKLMERAGLVDGKWMAVPWFHYADAWFMRKDVLAAANIKPEEIKTWDERRDAALQISNPDKQLWGWGLTPKSNTGDGDILARLLMDTHGANVTDESGTKVIWGTTNKEAAIKALEWAKVTYTDKKYEKMLPPGVLGWTGASNNENYLGGKIALTMNASSVYWAAKNQNSPYYKDTFVAPLASMPGKELSGGYPYYRLVFAKAKNRELAIKVARFMSEEKQSIERTRIAEGQSWPAFTTMTESQTFKDFLKSDPGYEQLFKNATHPSGWTVGYPGPLTPAASAVANQFLHAKAVESVVAGQITPAQAVDEMHRAAVELYKNFGFKQ